MSLTPGQRITMINECATLLDKSEWSDVDLILEQHGLPTSDMWRGDKRPYVIQMVKEARDNDLGALYTYLTSESDHSAPGKSPFKGDRLRLFTSHLATQREFVAVVGDRLALYGIEAFVAHNAIEPSLEWQQVIEAALGDCDAMAVFLHAGFRDSPWCDQEVGWAMGRGRPLLPLAFDHNPYGFMAKYQALNCAGRNGLQVGDSIADWLVKVPTLQTRLAASLSHAFRHSSSWDFTRRVAPLLEQISTFTEDQLANMEEAARVNVDVRECNIFGTLGPDWVADFVRHRRPPTIQNDWGTEGGF
jgi:TIR domain